MTKKNVKHCLPRVKDRKEHNVQPKNILKLLLLLVGLFFALYKILKLLVFHDREREVGTLKLSISLR